MDPSGGGMGRGWLVREYGDLDITINGNCKQCDKAGACSMRGDTMLKFKFFL